MSVENVEKKATETRFLANMSHEIRTPMNSIMGFIELVLEDSSLAPSHRSNLETALKSSRSLLSLINNILDLSKIESGTVSPAERQFDMKILLGGLESKWGTVAKKKGLTLSLECDESVQGIYIGDVEIIDKVLSMILDNAIKFTEHGSVRLVAGSGIIQNTVTFAIQDTGIGIHPSFLNEIFQPFTQGDSTNSRSYEGVGLGTTIAEKFTNLLGGEIVVESTYGEGSTFTINLPLRRDELKNQPLLETESSLEQSDRKFRILLVDDVETNLELAKVHLHRRGQEVETASNGLEAIDQCEAHSYDVVLMDIHMPVMNGVDAMKVIRETEGESRHTIIIALTADQMSEVRTPLLEEGFDDVVGKPVNFEDLTKMLQQSLPAELGTPLFSEKDDTPLEAVQHHYSGNSDDLEPLLKDIYEQLGFYNPSKVIPLLDELAIIVGESRLLSSVYGLVEAFECDRASNELARLAHSLGIELE